MSPIDRITQEALALPKDLKLKLVEQLVESLDSNIDKQAHKNQSHYNSMKSQDFWQRLEKLKQQMQEEEIEVNPQEIWGDVRDRKVGREITLP